MVKVIRPVDEEMAENLLRLMRQTGDENPFSFREQNEGLGPFESIHLWIRETRRSERQEAFIIYVGDVAAGYLIAEGEAYRRIQHRARLTMGCLKRYAMHNLERDLLKHAEAWGKAHGILRLETSIVDGDGSALKMYEQNGFTIEGRKRKAIRINGDYKDEILMARVVV